MVPIITEDLIHKVRDAIRPMISTTARQLPVVDIARAAIETYVAHMPKQASEAQEDEDFATRYNHALSNSDFEALARVLSGRLRQMDKRAKAANKRVTELEAALAPSCPNASKRVGNINV